ncbi:MAG: transcriptional repressor [Nitrospirae bacterium RBG_19FT_COMBO_55_12]|nr:MAG: transcriptional repressor [Nitrospirae bacterium RBG_19FT_COMBO_55_12]
MRQYRDIGFKLTPQRIAILDFLEGNKGHPSAEDVYKAVAKKFPTMSFATVYSTWQALKERGRVAELTVEPGKKRFDPGREPHHHLVCTRCRRIVDIHQSYKLTVSDKERAGFDITGNHIEFQGLCPSCKKE